MIRVVVIENEEHRPNFTRTRLFGDIKTAANLSAKDGNKNTLFNEEQRANLEKGVTAAGKIQPTESFPPKILTDLSISYFPTLWRTITAGANNIFDVYPDRKKNSRIPTVGYMYMRWGLRRSDIIM
jgi:hypothetical protein